MGTLHLDQADVVLRLDQAEQEVSMGIELRASRLALRARRALSGLARPAHPDDRGSDPDPEADRSLPRRHARQRRINHSIPQILTVGPRHAPPPPDPGRRTRMLLINRESPPESERAEHALALRPCDRRTAYPIQPFYAASGPRDRAMRRRVRPGAQLSRRLWRPAPLATPKRQAPVGGRERLIWCSEASCLSCG